STVGESVQRVKRHVAQPSAGAPDPVTEDRVDEARHSGAVPDVALESGATDHGAGRDRRACVGERELEEEEGEEGDARRPIGRGCPVQPEVRMPDETVTCAE